ncbi:MAG: phage tail protein [Burkholderiaceae bacterium]
MPSSIVLAAVFGDMLLAAAALGSVGLAVASFAINYAVSTIVTRMFSSDPPQSQPGVDPGNRSQVPPSAANGLPIVYGDAHLGGTFIDAALSIDQKTMYYVLAISSISPNGQFSFDTSSIYYGDQKLTFKSDGFTVDSVTDEAGGVDNKIGNGDLLQIYLYRSSASGVITALNSTLQPGAVMTAADLPSHYWGDNRNMNGLAFAIVKLKYNQEAGTTALKNVEFKCSHYLNGTGAAKPGDVWYDYITNPIYGGAVGLEFVGSPAAINNYADELITFTAFGGATQTQPRYRINGVLGSGVSVIENISRIMSSCDSWLSYQASTGKWVVVINKAEATSYAFSDANIIGAIRVSATDINQSINQIEAKFPFKGGRDAPAYVNQQTPANLLYPNEPVNKASITFDLVNDSVQASYLANRLLEQAREDLVVSFSTTYVGIQVDAGDVVSLTSPDYGWYAKLFRVVRVNEASLPDGSLGAKLELNEYSAAVFDNVGITAYSPIANSGLASPSNFGVIPAPVVSASFPNAAVPSFSVQPYIGSTSFVSVAEVWYSAYATPTPGQMYLGAVTQVPSSGIPYSPGASLPTVSLAIGAGNWYFFVRLANGVASSKFSPASALFSWRPTTFQYTERYLALAYANSSAGAELSFNPRNKSYYGLANVATANASSNPDAYTWFAASFETLNYLLYNNRASRKFSFAVGNAGYSGLGGAFVPSESSVYDQSVWSALPDGVNTIDLDARSGQVTTVGTTSVSSADGLLSVSNNTSGTMVVALEKFLNFGSGIYTKTANVSSLTIDVFGRVVGFTEQDEFYFTESVFDATPGQTSFSVTHSVGNILLWRDGVLLDPAEYTETSSTVVLANACAAGEKVVVFNMRAVNTSAFYEPLHITVASSSSNTVSYNDLPQQLILAGDVLSFSNSGSPTQYTVQSVNSSSRVITFTAAVSGATANSPIYRCRAADADYRPFSRFSVDVSNISAYQPSSWSIASGFELVYLNGVAFNEVDYDLSGNIISGFPANISGKLTIIQFAENNLGIPCSNVTNAVAYTNSGQLTYAFDSNPLAMAVSANGCLLIKGYDYNASNIAFNLTTAFPNNFTLLNQQTFSRIGAA